MSSHKSAISAVNAPILLVEDNPVNRRVALMLLRKAGYDVVVAEDGLTAVELAAARPLALILLDLLLPDLDGIEVAARVRALPQMAGIPIIAFSATEPDTDRHRWQAAGIDDYIAKPIERQQLLATLARWLATPVTVVALNESILDALEAETDHTVLEGAVRLFIEDTGVRLSTIACACANSDWQRVQREAHALKSSAGMFGAEQLQTLARQLERSCNKQDAEQVRRALATALPTAADPVLTALTDRYLNPPKNSL